MSTVKAKRRVLYVLMFLPLAVVLAALRFLPDQIPAHYNAAGQADRWGSKYETLIFPVVTVLFGFFMLGVARVSAKAEKDGENNEKIVLIAGIVSLLLFNAMTGYFLYTDFHRVEDLSALAFDVNQLLSGLLGLSMIVIGNIMPKLRMNSAIGLRTAWSLKNEEIWKKSQRFGGISFIIGGIAILAVCLMSGGLSCLAWSMGILTVIVVTDVCYTCKISKKY